MLVITTCLNDNAQTPLNRFFVYMLYSQHCNKYSEKSNRWSLSLALAWVELVLSRWVHFTVHSLDLVVFICVYFVFFLYCIYVVLLLAQWGGPSGIEALSLGLLFLQCFDTVGWVFRP